MLLKSVYCVSSFERFYQFLSRLTLTSWRLSLEKLLWNFLLRLVCISFKTLEGIFKNTCAKNICVEWFARIIERIQSGTESLATWRLFMWTKRWCYRLPLLDEVIEFLATKCWIYCGNDRLLLIWDFHI